MIAMTEWKTVHVEYGTDGNRMEETITLPGVSRQRPLTPKMAEQAAFVTCGHRDCVRVWDDEYQHGYRLYANSARKLSQS